MDDTVIHVSYQFGIIRRFLYWYSVPWRRHYVNT